MPTRGLALLTVLWAGIGCTTAQSTMKPARHPEVVLASESGEVRVQVELARTPQEHSRGLMYREHLPDGQGMLFLFDKATHQVFWMRNTYVSLDMIFITADKTVLGVAERAEPLTDDQRFVEGDSQYVLEVPGGFAAAHRIARGARVTFVDVD
jgi:uncharacterized membrane protein (UPF0127 family)